MCARLDHQFSRVIDAMKDTGLYDDTALFLFSDHGDFTGDYGLVEKTQNTFEDCLSRVPLIVKAPKETPVKAGIRGALVELVDFPATVFDLAGIDPGYDHFGKSLLPIMAGDTDTHRDAAFCEGGRRYGEAQAMEKESTSHLVSTGLYWPRVGLQSVDSKPYHSKAAMCRTENFKYVKRLYEQDELYDLTNDPEERRNVVNDPAYAPVLLKLKERLLTWYMETCDVVPRKTDKRESFP
jgi:arylsulfatase A-like enzyme